MIDKKHRRSIVKARSGRMSGSGYRFVTLFNREIMSIKVERGEVRDLYVDNRTLLQVPYMISLHKLSKRQNGVPRPKGSAIM